MIQSVFLMKRISRKQRNCYHLHIHYRFLQLYDFDDVSVIRVVIRAIDGC